MKTKKHKIKNIISIMFCIVMVVTGMSVFHVADNKFHAESIYGYLTKADEVVHMGETKIVSVSSGKGEKVYYNNTTPDTSKYVIFKNAVKSSSKNYDLVIYPFKGNKQAKVYTKYHGAEWKDMPCLDVTDAEPGYGGYKIVITEHNNLNKPVSMNVILGFSDLDGDEYCVLPDGFEVIHAGKNTKSSAFKFDSLNYAGTKYQGKITQASTEKQMYDECCVYGKTTIPTTGIIVFYGAGSGRSTTLAIDEIKDYWSLGYTIQFDANGGNGNVPDTIEKFGVDLSSDVVMGDIGNTIPTRYGYVFKGWSASPTFNSKRIAYSSSSGGSAASDGTSAATTSSSWSYATYCEKTGGDSSNNTLTLYAQWEEAPKYTYTIVFNANGGSGVPATKTAEGYDSSVVMGNISSTIPTRNGYSFKGWSASSSWNSKRIAYTETYGGSEARDGTKATITSSSWSYADYCSSTGGSVSSRTLTLYAQWQAEYANYKVEHWLEQLNGSYELQETETKSGIIGTTVVPPVKSYIGFTSPSPISSVVAADGSTKIVYKYTRNSYNVTYVDVDKNFGKELGRQVVQKFYGSTVKGIDIGSSTADNAYYNNYTLIPGADGYTTSVVNENGTTIIYRYFKWLTININGTISWNDNSNKYQTRPDNCTVRIYQDGGFIDSVIVSANDNINKYSFNDLLKYDPQTGKLYTYTVTQDEVLSQASLDEVEDKYETVQNGYDFKNTIRNIAPDNPPPTPDPSGFYVSGNIYWDDNEDSLGIRPSTVTITLYQKGKDGEWHLYKEPIIVDSKDENYYMFDWLPKYWYNDNDEPTKYEYKTEESFTAWYAEDGEVRDAYTIHTDQPNKFDFTNVFNKPTGPIIVVTEYENTVIIKTNTEEEVRVILKPLELYVNEDYSVTYGNETGDDILTMVDQTGEVISHTPSTRYEIVVDSPEYTVDDIRLSLEENMVLEQIDGKWYITIENQPKDAIGTIEIELSKKETYYQHRKRINNYFAWNNKSAKQPVIKKLSRFIATPDEAATIEYRDSLTTDVSLYSVGEEVEILDYLGTIPNDKYFAGWAITQDSNVPDYLAGDMVEIKEDIVLYPVFEDIVSGAEDVDTDIDADIKSEAEVETDADEVAEKPVDSM